MTQTTVAVDALGGDHAPDVVVEGALLAARSAPPGLRLALVGPEADLRARLDALGGAGGLNVDVVDAPEAVGMDESPTAALKGKPRSSMHVGVGLVKAGAAQAFVTAGNTGAAMAISLFGLGRVEGVSRPSLVGFFPSARGRCLVLDVGSNVDCRAEHLVQFARMGAVYAERVLGRAAPRVGLLNVGEEPGKGNDLAKETYPLLAAAEGLAFVGNVEGRDVLKGAADVIVCDGFVGNVLLKFGESLKTVLPAMMAGAAEQLALGEAERAGLARVLGGVTKGFDYEAAGGAPLLGVAGNVLIGHGSSSPKAIASLVQAGADVAAHDLAGALAAAFAAASKADATTA